MSTHRFQYLTLLCVVFALSGCDCCVDPDGIFTPNKVRIEEAGEPGGTFMVLLSEQLVFRDGDGKVWTAPRGTLTDGASVPRIFLSVTNGRFDRRFFKAAIVHDAYCQKENENICPDQYQSRPWRDVHRMFYNACLAGETPPQLAGAMFAAVWWRGPKWGDPESDLHGVSEDLLQVAVDGSASYIQEEAPEFEEIVAWLETREPALRRIGEIESEFERVLDREDPEAVGGALRNADAALEASLTQLPDDPLRDNLRAYHFKHRAETLKRVGRTEDAARETGRAEQAFEKVLEVRPDDPSAKNGMDLIRRGSGATIIPHREFERTEPDVEATPLHRRDAPS